MIDTMSTCAESQKNDASSIPASQLNASSKKTSTCAES